MENKTVVKAEVTEASLLQVNSLLLPVIGTVLLVPQLSVAEVLSSNDLSAEDVRLDKTPGSPHGYGWVHWRDQNVPLLSFDSIYSGQRPSLDQDLKIVICNTVFAATATGFYALVVTGFPRALRLNMDTKMAVEGSMSDLQGVQMRVMIDGEEVLVPDFEFIEQVVCEIAENKES